MNRQTGIHEEDLKSAIIEFNQNQEIIKTNQYRYLNCKCISADYFYNK